MHKTLNNLILFLPEMALALPTAKAPRRESLEEQCHAGLLALRASLCRCRAKQPALQSKKAVDA